MDLSWLLGSLSCFLILFLLGILLHRPRSNSNFILLQNQDIPLTSTNWLNVLFMKLTSTHIDYELIRQITPKITQILSENPSKPSFVSKIEISAHQPSQKEPILHEVKTLNNALSDSLQISFVLKYDGKVSILLNIALSAGFWGMEDLLTAEFKVEVLLKLLIAHISIDFSNDNSQATLTIGNDLVVDLEIRPFVGGSPAQSRYIESISSWINSIISSSIAGKSFPLYE